MGRTKWWTGCVLGLGKNMPYKNIEDRHANNLKYRREHSKRVNELNRSRYNADKEAVNARRRELYAEHRDYMSIYRHKQRIAKPEQNQEWGRNYRQKYPEKMRERARIDRARKLNAPGNGITHKQEKHLFEEYDYRCVYCGSKKDITIDHVVALNRGGANDITNAIPACKSCNASKCDKPLLIWMRSKIERISNGQENIWKA